MYALAGLLMWGGPLALALAVVALLGIMLVTLGRILVKLLIARLTRTREEFHEWIDSGGRK